MPLPYATKERVKTTLGITGTSKDAIIEKYCLSANRYVETLTHRSIGSSSVSGQIIDGFGVHIQDGGYVIDYPHGIRSISSLEIKLTTDGDYATVPAADYFIGPRDAYRAPDWPGFYIALTNIPSAGNSTPYVLPAYGAIRLSADIGWAEMPDDLRSIAEVAVSRAYQARQAGHADDVGVDEFGESSVSRVLTKSEKSVILQYRWLPVEVID